MMLLWHQESTFIRRQMPITALCRAMIKRPLDNQKLV
jgi:hypothetical protein